MFENGFTILQQKDLTVDISVLTSFKLYSYVPIFKVTHMPPFGILDSNSGKIKSGTLILDNINYVIFLGVIRTINPKMNRWTNPQKIVQYLVQKLLTELKFLAFPVTNPSPIRSPRSQSQIPFPVPNPCSISLSQLTDWDLVPGFWVWAWDMGHGFGTGIWDWELNEF